MKGLIFLGILVITLIGCSHSTEPPLSVPFTAKSKLNSINSLAQSYKKGVQLMSVSSPSVSSEGQAESWRYSYCCADTVTPPKLYWFHADAKGVGFDSISLMGVGTAIITHAWFNSDSAMLISEENGGAKFRSDNPDYVITASLGEPLAPNPSTYWYIDYYSSSDKSKSVLFIIDANTGAVRTYGPD